jgi:GcrA cell cycle regulator
MSWTDKRVDQLKTLWKGGASASQIADALGGVTRNAVIGKAHRLRLEARPGPIHQSDDSKKPASLRRTTTVRTTTGAHSPVPDSPAITSEIAAAAAGKPQDRAAPSVPPAPPRRKIAAKPSAEMRGKVGMLDLTDKICKWPLGHPGEPDFHFCGEPINRGFPYCRPHCAAAYQAPRERGYRPAPRAGRPRFG